MPKIALNFILPHPAAVSYMPLHVGLLTYIAVLLHLDFAKDKEFNQAIMHATAVVPLIELLKQVSLYHGIMRVPLDKARASAVKILADIDDESIQNFFKGMEQVQPNEERSDVHAFFLCWKTAF